ncbi:MAG: TIGR01906 family membrane protein [Erysipelotrichaceae bacterium]|nr:TIGR01906 family membrane protein [Erysipelotrichaceae bacterium]
MKTFFTNNRLRDIVLALLLTVFLICFAVTFTVFFKPLYYFDIDYLHIDQLVGMSKETLKANYDSLIAYQSIFYQGELILNDFVMSETGRIHFEEVKRIFEVVQVLMVVSGVASGVMIYQNAKQKEYRYLKITPIFSIGIPAILGFLAALDFDRAFVIFHQIFFNNNYWIFDATTDPIIEALPETFFMHCFMMIIAIVIILSIILYLLYRHFQKTILKSSDSI